MECSHKATSFLSLYIYLLGIVLPCRWMKTEEGPWLLLSLFVGKKKSHDHSPNSVIKLFCYPQDPPGEGRHAGASHGPPMAARALSRGRGQIGGGKVHVVEPHAPPTPLPGPFRAAPRSKHQGRGRRLADSKGFSTSAVRRNLCRGRSPMGTHVAWMSSHSEPAPRGPHQVPLLLPGCGLTRWPRPESMRTLRSGAAHPSHRPKLQEAWTREPGWRCAQVSFPECREDTEGERIRGAKRLSRPPHVSLRPALHSVPCNASLFSLQNHAYQP